MMGKSASLAIDEVGYGAVYNWLMDKNGEADDVA